MQGARHERTGRIPAAVTSNTATRVSDAVAQMSDCAREALSAQTRQLSVTVSTTDTREAKTTTIMAMLMGFRA